MMAANRYKLRSLTKAGHQGAKLTTQLLSQTDKLLGVILLGNSLINAAAAALATIITFRLIGNDRLALSVATVGVTFAILVFSEATPKIVAATYPEKLAVAISFPLAALSKVFYPAVWFINLFVRLLLTLMGLGRKPASEQNLTPEELRLLVLEAGPFVGKKHHSILMNLFDLQASTVDDIMVPRRQVEALDLNENAAVLCEQLSTCHHTRLPVYEGSLDSLQGIVHTRKLLNVSRDSIDADAIRSVMREPYYIPAGTPLFTQLQNFQENHRRLGCVVDEYGELLGLVTIEDILEQIIGEFTSNTPSQGGARISHDQAGYVVEGSNLLRDINRRLGMTFPLDGPKTINGLVIEYFQDIPEAGTCMTVAGQRMEILQTQGRSVKAIRIYFPVNPS